MFFSKKTAQSIGLEPGPGFKPPVLALDALAAVADDETGPEFTGGPPLSIDDLPYIDVAHVKEVTIDCANIKRIYLEWKETP